MFGLSLTARVVEVIADRGEAAHPRYRYGSGCIVAGRTVLTAAHVVAGAASVRVRTPDKAVHQATLDLRFVGDADGPGPDLALVEINEPGIDLRPIGLAAVDRDSPTGDPVERCHAIGYPAFMEQDTEDGSPFRDTVDACGYVPVLSGLAGGLLSVQVSSVTRELPQEQVTLGDSQWSGMSGGPLVAEGSLLGVVTEHVRRAGPSSITVTPLTALEADPAHPGWGSGVADPGAWWDRLGVSGVDRLALLPARRQRMEPAYRATVREIHRRTGLLIGRQRELAEITSFAVGSEGYRRLVGDAWAGKTSLVAEAVAAALPGEVDVVSYFLSRCEANADSGQFLTAVVPQLAYLCGIDPPTADLGQFRALWERAVENANARNRHLLLVVDGLDEDLLPDGLPSVAAVMPTLAGPYVHVLVTSRPFPDLPGDMPPGHPLDLTQPVVVEPFEGAEALAALARQEIDDLLRRDHKDELAPDVLGLLAAAAGPLSVEDLATLTEVAPRSASLKRRIRHLLTVKAARSLQPVGPVGCRRYQFAHLSLLEHAQSDENLSDPDFRDRVHQWQQRWRDAGWPSAVDAEGTPRYLLDTYPSTLAGDPKRLAALVSDIGWVEVAVQSIGVDRVLANLRQAAAEDPTAGGMLAVVAGQAFHLRPPWPVDQPGYVLRQLCLQAVELTEDRLADDLRAKLRSRPGIRLVPLWTTRRANRALSDDLGHHDNDVKALVVLPDGRVVSGGNDGRVLVWDPAKLDRPETGPVELGRHDGAVTALARLPDERVVSAGQDGRVFVWAPDMPGRGPTKLGSQTFPVAALAVLPDGRVVSGGYDREVLLRDPSTPGGDSVELGSHDSGVSALAVLPGGRVVSGDSDGQVLLWDPSTRGGDSVKLGSHESGVSAMAVLPGGRVVSVGMDRRVLLWDPSTPGRGSVELGSHLDKFRLGYHTRVSAVAVLPDGRVVSGDDDGQVLLWDPSTPGGRSVELGRHHGSGYDKWVGALAVLPDGRVVSVNCGGQQVLLWDLAAREQGPVELRGDYDGRTLAALPGGQLVSAARHWLVVVWDGMTFSAIAHLGCSVATLATGSFGAGEAYLAVAHIGGAGGPGRPQPGGLSVWSVLDER